MKVTNVGVKVLDETRADDGFEPHMALYVNEVVDGELVQRVIAELDFNGAETLMETLEFFVGKENAAFRREYGYLYMTEDEVL